MRMLSACIAAVAVFAGLTAATATPFPAKAYGYVSINSTYGSSMFYALSSDDTVPATKRAERPLVMFLQGGPGASSLFSYYLETGPTKIEATSATTWSLVNRSHTWIRHANMLYVDNPVGTGFSYTNDPRGFSTTDEGIASNLVLFMQGFLVAHPEFKGKPFWVFCESYGGKMAAYFGAALVTAGLDVNFKGVALGDGWVDPISCMKSYGPYLQAFSQLTAGQAANITAYADFAQDALERGDGNQATNWWGAQQNAISTYTNGVYWYNDLYYYDYTADNQFETFAQTTLQTELGSLIPSGVNFDSQATTVFNAMSNAFMRDGVSQVQTMINANVSVNVYSGQVDLIVDTLCIQRWISKLQWSDLPQWLSAPRVPFQESNDQNVAGFVQSYKNFAFWQINKAGHMVPLDRPWSAEYMFATIIGADTSNIPPSSEAQMKVPPKDKAGVVHARKPKFVKP
jgi:serine carboxypeptidase 1